MLNVLRWLVIVACWLGAVARVFAQEAAPPQEPVVPAAEPERVAPSVIELPDIVLPEGAPAIESVTATILVSVEGGATLEESDAPPEIAAAITDALSRARFAPAKVNGEPVVARVRIVLRVSAPVTTPPPPADEPTPTAPVVDDPLPPNPFEEEAPAAYQATGRTKPVPPAARRLQIEEMRDVPGTFGDPFRILDTLPGVLPIFSGLPYVYVRGAPPASTSYVYDDISIPLLFHFGIAAAVVHPAMLGDLLFYSSVAPARYGRKTGGVFGAEGPDLQADKLHGEVELRLIDVSTMLNVPVGDGGSITAAARYGYPGAVASLLVEDFTLSYWDYQLRVDLPVGSHDRFQLAWFGSFDKAGEPGDEITITFHRVETRLIHEVGAMQLGAALQLGFDQTGVTDGFQIESARFGPRMWLSWKPSYALSLHVGADMLATAGEITNEDSSSEGGGPRPDPGGGPRPNPGGGPMPEPGGGDGGGDEDPLAGGDPVSQRVKGRNMMGAYAELRLRPNVEWELGLGLRADLWMTGTAEQAAAEPRASVTYHPTRDSDVFFAAGLAYQPAVFPLPIPGLADIVLDNGLQRAIQTETGYRRDLGDELRVETSLFFSHYSGMLFFETAFDCSQEDPVDDTDPDSDCENGRFPRATSDAYGWEVFLKRPSHHRVSGWISYTLGRATAESAAGREIIPQTDVRHFGSAVVSIQLGRNWTLGSRLFARSGRVPFEKDIYRPNHRLPGFYRLDLTLANRWKTSWGHMRLSLEWFNVTFSREAIAYNCELQYDMTLPDYGEIGCTTEYAPAIVIPNIGLRGEF